MRLARSLLVLPAVAALIGIAAAPASAQAATSLPADPAAHGYLGLCGPDGKQVTGGYVDVAPFVWKAVSSVAAPRGYTGRGQNADLVIAQPREGVPAAYWSVAQLTAASFYSTAAHPTAQATTKDVPLSQVLHQYPDSQDGLYVLRMDVARMNYGIYTATYPTAVIKVTGDRWTEVSHGAVDCAAGQAVSQETVLGTVSKQQSSAQFAQRQAAREEAAVRHDSPDDSASARASSAANGSAVGAGASGSRGAAYRDAASATSSDHGLSGGDDALVALGAVVLLGLGTGGAYRLRRRSKS